MSNYGKNTVNFFDCGGQLEIVQAGYLLNHPRILMIANIWHYTCVFTVCQTSN